MMNSIIMYIIIPFKCVVHTSLYHSKKAGPDGSFILTGACNLDVLGSNPGRADICHCGCAYTVFKTVRRPAVHSAVYRTVHYIEPFKIRVGHSLGFGLPSVAILPLC